MKILVPEDNLMWSAKLIKGLKILGEEPILIDRWPAELPDADAAIVNLGSPRMPFREIVAALKAKGIYSVAHAGHVEKELRAAGVEAGCDLIVAHSSLADHLDRVVEQMHRRAKAVDSEDAHG